MIRNLRLSSGLCKTRVIRYRLPKKAPLEAKSSSAGAADITMLAAFHRKLVSAPFLGVPTHHTLKRFERINEGPTMIQKNLRENAAAICASSGCKLPVRNHLDDHGLSLLYTDNNTSVAGRSGVRIACVVDYRVQGSHG